MYQEKFQEILYSLQSCYKISVINEYDQIQEDLLSLIVDLKNLLNSEIKFEEKGKMIDQKDAKDRTRFNIKFKLNGKILSNLPKSRIPQKVFEYLIQNNLLKEFHLSFFLKNNFRTTCFFDKEAGDLVLQTDNPKRYNDFTFNDKTYFACNQWDRPAIDKFNEYINTEFSDSIEIKADE